MAKKKSPVRKKTVPQKGTVISIPKKFAGNEKLQTKAIKNYLAKEGKGSTKKYQQKIVQYLNVYTNTEGTIQEAIDKTKREVTEKRDNRLQFIKKTKDGKRLWRDNKTGKTVKGRAVREIVWNSTRVKTIETLASKLGVSYKQAEKKYLSDLDKQYNRVKKQKRVKDAVKQWKKEGMSTKQIKERLENVSKGKAELFLIRYINQSPTYVKDSIK